MARSSLRRYSRAASSKAVCAAKGREVRGHALPAEPVCRGGLVGDSPHLRRVSRPFVRQLVRDLLRTGADAIRTRPFYKGGAADCSALQARRLADGNARLPLVTAGNGR
eukprot:6500951-Pyramimonas_sp.AAC.1